MATLAEGFCVMKTCIGLTKTEEFFNLKKMPWFIMDFNIFGSLKQGISYVFYKCTIGSNQIGLSRLLSNKMEKTIKYYSCFIFVAIYGNMLVNLDIFYGAHCPINHDQRQWLFLLWNLCLVHIFYGLVSKAFLAVFMHILMPSGALAILLSAIKW